MLCYLGMGERRYGLHPIRPYKRPYWEFQAVLRGSISLHRDSGPDLLRSKHLWLCSPQYSHGWTGEGSKSAEIVVFHFLGLPEPLSQFATQSGCIELPLADAQCERLHALALAARQFWKRPAPGMMLYHQHLLLELSWLVYSATHPSCPQDPNAAATTAPAGSAGSAAAQPQSRRSAEPVHESPEGVSSRFIQGHERVNDALMWFQNHLAANPSLEDVARAIGLSSSQLRRLFQANMDASPKKVFDQLRFQHAMELMSDPRCKLSTVSEACGFDSASAFSRAFKHKFGTSPDKWRG